MAYKSRKKTARKSTYRGKRSFSGRSRRSYGKRTNVRRRSTQDIRIVIEQVAPNPSATDSPFAPKTAAPKTAKF